MQFFMNEAVHRSSEIRHERPKSKERVPHGLQAQESTPNDRGLALLIATYLSIQPGGQMQIPSMRS